MSGMRNRRERGSILGISVLVSPSTPVLDGRNRNLLAQKFVKRYLRGTKFVVRLTSQNENIMSLISFKMETNLRKT